MMYVVKLAFHLFISKIRTIYIFAQMKMGRTNFAQVYVMTLEVIGCLIIGTNAKYGSLVQFVLSFCSNKEE